MLTQTPFVPLSVCNSSSMDNQKKEHLSSALAIGLHMERKGHNFDGSMLTGNQ